MDSAFRVSLPSNAGALLVQVGPLGREALLGIITQGRIELKITEQTCILPLGCVRGVRMYV